MKKKLVSLIQLAIGIGLIVFIFANMRDRGDLLEALRAAARHWPLLVLGFSLFFVCLFVCTLRWKTLLDARGLVLPFRRTLALYFVGHFFNSFLFGATGGDVVKAWFVSRELHGKKTEAVSTVFIDRVVGLIALVGLTVVVMAVRFRFFVSYPETRMALAFNAALLAGTVVGFLVVFRRSLLERWSLFRRLEDKTALGAVVGRVYTTFHLCLNEPVVLAKTLALSLVNHLVLIVSVAVMGRALEIDLGFGGYLTTFPVINAVAAVPLTPGGLGTREGAAKYLLGVLGVPETRAVMLSLLVYACMLAWSLVGGVVYLFYIYGKGRPVVTEEGSA